MKQQFTDIIKAVGEDPNREGLQKTPERASKAFQHLTSGYNQSVSDVVNGAIYPCEIDEMIIVQGIEFYSLCEHHLIPFFGECHVAYLPRGKVLGLSKIPRIVDIFARRLQIQELLTKQIADTILEVTDAKGVGVIIEARHLCMMMRGVQKQNSLMKTSIMLGKFRQDERTRLEFLNLIA